MGAAGSVQEAQLQYGQGSSSKSDLGTLRLSLDFKDAATSSNTATDTNRTTSIMTPTARGSTLLPFYMPGSPKVQSSSTIISQSEYPYLAFAVKLEKWNSNQAKLLCGEFSYRIGREVVDFIDRVGQPILQFPFQNIVRWSQNTHEKTFQFEVYDWKSSYNGKKYNGIKVLLSTADGLAIDACMKEAVSLFVNDLNIMALPRTEFEKLLVDMFIVGQGLNVNWKSIFDMATVDWKITAKQGIHLMKRISVQAPFETLEFACLMYSTMLYHESFQAVISALDDGAVRSNIIHELMLKYGSCISSAFTAKSVLGHGAEISFDIEDITSSVY